MMGPPQLLERPIFRGITAAAALGSLAHVAVLVPRYIIADAAVPLSIRIFVGSIVITVLAAVAGSVLALTLVVRSWDLPGARSLALFLAALSTLWGSILRWVDIEAAGENLSIQLRASNSFQMGVLSTAVIVASAAFLRFSALFPAQLDGGALPPTRRFGWLRRARVALLRARPVWLIALFATAATVGYSPVAERILALVTTGSITPGDMLATDAGARRVWLTGLIAIAVTTMLIMPVGAMLLAVRNLFAGYRIAEPAQRRRLLWLVAGTSIGAWMILIPLIGVPLFAMTRLSADWLSYIAGLLWFFAPAVLVGSVAVAIFYSGAVDPALVLKRSTVYGILGALAFVLFTALESVLSNFFEATLGLPGLAGSIAAGVLAAGLLVPARGALARVSLRVAPAETAE